MFLMVLSMNGMSCGLRNARWRLRLRNNSAEPIRYRYGFSASALYAHHDRAFVAFQAGIDRRHRVRVHEGASEPPDRRPGVRIPQGVRGIVDLLVRHRRRGEALLAVDHQVLSRRRRTGGGRDMRRCPRLPGATGMRMSMSMGTGMVLAVGGLAAVCCGSPAQTREQ